MKRIFGFALLATQVIAFQNLDAQTTKLSSSFFGSMEAREIGPAVMSGRILSIDAFNDDPILVYVGAASGGLWKSTNGGTTFKEVFKDHVQTIGAVAINQKNKDNVWVGTGDTRTNKYIYNLPVFGLFELPLKSNVRFEFAHKPNTHFNRMEVIGEKTWLVKNVTRRDLIGYAMEIGHDFMPQFICKYNGQRSVDVTFGIFQDRILNHDRNLNVSGYNRGAGDVSTTSFSLDATTDWFNQELMTKFNYSYNTSGYGSFWAFFQYAPGQHWRFTLLPRITWSNAGPLNNKADFRHQSQTNSNDTLNYIHFKIGYLF